MQRPSPRPVHGREQQSGDKGKMIDEEAELGLISGPM
jgi:hypothetical protein